MDRTGKFIKTLQVVNEVVNPLPGRYAHVVSLETAQAAMRGEHLSLASKTDVFITAADVIAGITDPVELARRLTLVDKNGQLIEGPFGIIEFTLGDLTDISSPVFRANPGFISGGVTLGGAREYIIPNKQLSELDDVVIRVIGEVLE